ncbi:MAG: hypothetical protein EZS28_013843 [Streblomastix strix]|uniref:Uncharacterized protein n=1 Tax=Streblomastix strix TaxID=222440 RepID=A0A5J4W766_9EUKA|nr:MAG: hypothetical protein EZS28_013843 [Streblomastix strix]
MSFKFSDYLGRLAIMQHSDYVSRYMQLGEILKTLSIHPQSFEISKQNFFDSPITELTSRGVKYIRAPLGARGKSTCSMVQTCQVNWTITLPENTLAIQLNKTFNDWNTIGKLIQRTNFSGKEDPTADWTDNITQTAQGYFDKTAQRVESSEHQQFWIGFTTACGPFYQFQLLKDATTQWGSAIYAREQAVISGNSLSDLRTKNSIKISPLEGIIEGKRQCGVFINIPLCEVDTQEAAATVGTPFYYRIPNDITFSGVLDLNQLNPIFNLFLVLTRNQATLHLQLQIQDFLQDLKVVLLNKIDTIQNNHLAYHMILLEKPDIVYLLAGDDATDLSYKRYNVRIVNMQNAAIVDKIPQNSISQIGTAKFDVLEIQNVCFNTQNENAIICMIQQQKIINFPTQVFRTQSTNFPFSGFDKNSGSRQSILSFSIINALFMTFAMPKYPTWFFPELFTELNLVIDQNNVIPQPYKLLNQEINGQMFDCFVDQDVVSAPSDQYHLLTFENLNIDEQSHFYGWIDNDNQYKTANLFYLTTLYSGSKAVKTLYPNKYMLAWKLADDDSFMRGFNSSNLGARTNVQVILQRNLTKGIIDTTNVSPSWNQIDFKQFIGTRAYPDPNKTSITPMMHYLCDTFVRIIFDDSSIPQVLNIDVIGELAKGAIQSQRIYNSSTQQ